MKLRLTIIFFTTSLAFGQSRYGIFTGSISSSENNAPIVGSTIIVQNTTLGTVSDVEGKFSIKKIPQGEYSVAISMMGYQRKIVKSVIVKSDEETLLNIQLIPSLIQTDAVVVTASRREQTLEEVPVSMNIVDAQTLIRRSTTAVDEALRYVPGVNLTQSQVNIRGSTGYSRGVGSRVLLLVDGLPLLAGDTKEPIFESIPIFQVDRIEVVKGSGSALYGTSALGGVINVLTKDIADVSETRWRILSKIYDKPPYEEWKWTNKWRQMNAQYISHTQRFGDLDLVFAGSRVLDDSYRENDWMLRYNGYLKAKYKLSPFHSITLSSSLMWHHRGDFIWWKDIDNPLRPANSQLNFNITSIRINSSLLYKHFVNDNFFFEFKATRYYTDWHEDSLNVDRSNESQADAYSTEIQATYITGENNTLIFGAVANNDYVSSNLFGRHSGYGGAFYFQDEYKFTDKIKANLGLRFDYQEVAGIASNQQWNPKFGLLYQAEENTTIRATVGRGFRAPSIAELFVATNVSTSSVAIIPSTDLKTEHSWSYEIGCIRNLADNIVIDASVFRGDFSDLIEAGVEYDTTRKSPIIRFRNVTEARIQGFEISVRTSFLRQILSIDLNYMYTWPYDLKKKSVLKFRPRHIASINAVATHKKFSFGSDFRFISKVDAIDDDLVRLAPIKDGEQRVPIYIIDVRASYDFSNFIMPIRVNFQINNILRYSYVELIGNMAPMRTFLLGIEGAF